MLPNLGDGYSDVVKVVIGGRVYLATRQQFDEFTDLSAMLEMVVCAGALPSEIHHIFDDSPSAAAVGERFLSWQDSKKRKLFLVPNLTKSTRSTN